MTEHTAQDASPTSAASPRKTNIFTAYPFSWEEVHKELLEGRYSGVYGWDHAAYWGIAEKKQGVDLTDFYKKRGEAEFYLPEWKELLDNPETQRHWARIVTFDPLGMYGLPPTIASCRATLTMPELMDLDRDGVIVDSEGGIKCSKAAVYYAWNIPHLAERLQLSEAELRDGLHKYSNDAKVLDPNIKVHLPAVGGFTIYAFGDVRKIRDPATEIAVRVHDECIGSDVFGSDICTCRPYLIFAMRHAIECAQRGGVGIVVYYRKEGRSLGEVIKFRVYNARTNQAGGDRPEMYFHQTESIAGIRDARFQTMMPDALVWMGISRIDWLLSMSAEKYDAICEAGIQVMQRVSLPDDYVPKAASVEIDAKVASGYHAEFVDRETLTNKLLEPGLIRERCAKIYALAQRKQLTHFQLDESKIDGLVDYVGDVMIRNYSSGSTTAPTTTQGISLRIPNHSRLGHFRSTVYKPLYEETWKRQSALEKTRRLIDLCTVSVILDAGAGTQWKYVCPFEGTQYRRSEGIAQATLDMFVEGKFSSDAAVKTRVNSTGLTKLTMDEFKHGFHVRGDNAILGLEQRLGLLHRLGAAMEQNAELFGVDGEVFRPGNIVDWLLPTGSVKGGSKISALKLWSGLIKSLTTVWPSSGRGWMVGDCWMHNKLKSPKEAGSDLIPFHKLTQWLVYTIMDVMEKELGVEFVDQEALTALAEYRNGGLLVDGGVLKLRDPRMQTKKFAVGSELIVEWRALTIVLIDKIAEKLRQKFGVNFTMSQILEGGTWRAGRELAFKLRSDGSPPIAIESDGTVF